LYIKDNDFVKKRYSFTIDKRDYQLKIEEASAAMAGAEGNFEVSKADIGSALASISVSDANVQSARQILNLQKLDWIVLPVITTDTTICIKAILSPNNSTNKHWLLNLKQRFKVRVVEQQQRASAFQKISDYCQIKSFR
jgi:membrane fusion protein (multidrug efflux system)